MSSERIPGIKELRQRVYKSEEIYGRIPWISKRFIHPHISIYLTWFFLHVRMIWLHVDRGAAMKQQHNEYDKGYGWLHGMFP